MSQFVIPYSVVCELLFNREYPLEQGLREQYPELQGERLLLVTGAIKKRFQPNFAKKLREVHHVKRIFFRKYSEWLQGEFLVNFPESDHESENESSLKSVGGRPEKPFEDLCKRSKQNKIKKLREDFSDELIIAAAEQIKKEKQADPMRYIDSKKALGLIFDASLTKYQYEILRKCVKEVGCNIFLL